MAIRVTVDEVLAILPPGLPALPVTPFISTANLVVEEDLVGKGMSESRLKEIEKYLAAHFATVTTGELTARKVGDSMDDFVKTRMYEGLRGTTFGQQAVSLDASNTLVDTDKRDSSFEIMS